MTDRPTLAIIVVSWNVRELLRRCLLAVTASLAGSGIAHETIVVDNASADGTPTMLRAEFPAVRLVEPGANLGFGGGNNAALRLVLAEGAARYVLLLNPDTEPVGDAIPTLVRWLEAHPAVAAVGPLLRYGDGAPQPSRRRFPTLTTMLWESTVLDRLWPGNPWAARYRCADTPDNRAQPVGWLVGAAILARAEAVRRAGLFDERFFLYSEELEWQARMQRTWHAGPHARELALSAPPTEAASAIWYLPEAVVTHHEGRSSEQAVAVRHLSFSRSKVLLARIWYGWRAARMLRRALRAGFLYEVAAEGAKLLLGHRSDLRRQRIGVYWRVLRDL